MSNAPPVQYFKDGAFPDWHSSTFEAKQPEPGTYREVSSAELDQMHRIIHADRLELQPIKLDKRISALYRAHIELAAMVAARLDRLEALAQQQRFDYNGGL